MKLILSFFCIMFSHLICAQVTWDFEGETASVSSVPTGFAADDATFGAGVAGISFPAGDGSVDAYSGNSWSTTGRNATEFLQFCTTNGSVSSFDVTNIAFGERRSGSGPRTFDIEYSIDGGAPVAVATAVSVPDNTSWRDQTFSPAITPTLATGQEICFSIFGYNAEAAAGTWRFDDVVISVMQVVPVQLLTFSGTANNSHSNLSWTTASEVDNDYFDVQSSSDGKNFETIGKVHGNGTTSSEQSYDFTDRNPKAGVNFYRLAQHDYNGAMEYHKVISVLMRSNQTSIYPTNASHSITVEIEEPSIATIISADGKLLSSTAIQESGTLDVSSLPCGIYYIRILTDQSMETHRFIKK